MRFVFAKLFYLLIALGFIPLAFSWGRPGWRWLAFAYDAALLIIVFVDARRSRLPAGISIAREFSGRFAVGAETEVQIHIQDPTASPILLMVKDEYPPQMKLAGMREARLRVEAQTSARLIYGLTPPRRGRFEFGQIAVRFLSRLNLAWCEMRVGEVTMVKVYQNMRRAREAELKALGARALVSTHRKASWRGEGREFESMRDYVRGDELRHISWTATARRGKLTTRQYQIERDQTILIALDAGRLMTSRIENLSKLDHAINAALSIGYVATRGGDNIGLLVFNRQVAAYLPPQRGHAQLAAMTEALYNVKAQMIEPSYARAFQYLSQNCKRRSLVVILTDLVDRDASAELLAYAATLLPRHLPLIVT